MALVSKRALLAAPMLTGITTEAAAARLARCATSSSGGGGGGGGRKAPAKDRAADYLKKRERKPAGGGPDAGDSPPRSRLAEAAAEFSEAQQAWMLSSPSGLGVGAEAAIAQAIKEGALDDLPGKGKPLPAVDHSAQFGSTDPLVAALTRTMGAQGVRPLSLELQEEVRRDLAALRRQLEAELRRALAAGTSAGEPQPASSSGGEPSSSSSSQPSSSGGSGWLSRLLGAARQGGDAAPSSSSSASSSSSSRRQPTVGRIRAGQHPPLRHAAAELSRLIKQYNHAVLADKEAFGSAWPLDRMRPLDWGEEVNAALQAILSGGSSSSGNGGGGG